MLLFRVINERRGYLFKIKKGQEEQAQRNSLIVKHKKQLLANIVKEKIIIFQCD